MTHDLWMGLRSLGRRPLLAAVTLSTLALGVGGATAIFSVAWAAVLGPSRFAHPDRLMVAVERGSDGETMPVDLPTAREWQGAPAFAAAGMLERGESVVGRDAPSKLPVAYASAGVFSALEVSAARGRLFGAADDARGSAPVALLSDGGWRRLTAADPNVLGRTLLLDGRPHTIVGVLPASFGFGSRVDVWVSLGSWRQSLPPEVETSRSEKSLVLVARLRQGASAAAAAAQLTAICSNDATSRGERPAITASVRPLVGWLRHDNRSPLLLLLAAVATLLAVACFDLAVLWLVRAYDRRAEIAVRRALGASSTRILRLLAMESVTVCALGGGLGVGLGALAVRWFEHLLPVDVVIGRVGLEPVAIVAGLAIPVAAGALFAAMPLVGSRSLVSLRGARGSRGSRESSRASSVLVAAQLAGATALLQVGLLLVASLARLLAVDPGFVPERAIVASLTLGSEDARDAPTAIASWQRALEAVGDVPDVVAAGATTHAPLSPANEMNVEVEGAAVGPAGSPLVTHSSVAGDLFAALGTRVVAGRAFAAADRRADADPSVIVNAAMERRYWPGQSAVGKRLRWAIPGLPPFPWRTVVGVVADARDEGLDQVPRPAAYYPIEQLPPEYLPVICKQMTLVARFRNASDTVVPRLRTALAERLPGALVGQIEPIAATLAASVARPRLYARLIAAFAALALLLAALGIHGVLAATVEQQRQELGVRLAVGARPHQLRKLVVYRGLRLAAIGVAVGLPAGIAAAHALAALLYGVSTTDPRWSLAVAASIVVVSAAGSLIPARRAMRTEPLQALSQP